MNRGRIDQALKQVAATHGGKRVAPTAWLFFRRDIEIRTGSAGSIVYAVRPIPKEQRTDPVRAWGAFPPGWHPTDHAGQILFNADVTQQYWFCEVPRKWFLTYPQITEAEAKRLYPGIRPQ